MEGIEKKGIQESLAAIPDLVEACENIIKSNEKTQEISAKIIQTGMKATVPSDEVKRVADAIAETVSQTPCAAPDTSAVSGLIAEGVTRELGDVIKTAVQDSLKNTRVVVDHQHYHTTAWALVKVAEEKTRVWLIILASLVTALSLFLAIGSYIHLNSEDYYGKEYLEVVWSDFTTEKERESLWKDVYPTGALPKSYSKSPEHFKQALERNKAILKDRERQANNNKGRFSTVPALEQ